MINNPTTTQYWTDFLACEYDLAKSTSERTWQAIPYSLSPAEYVAVISACSKLGYKLLRSSSTQRYVLVQLKRTTTKGKK